MITLTARLLARLLPGIFLHFSLSPLLSLFSLSPLSPLPSPPSLSFPIVLGYKPVIYSNSVAVITLEERGLELPLKAQIVRPTKPMRPERILQFIVDIESKRNTVFFKP